MKHLRSVYFIMLIEKEEKSPGQLSKKIFIFNKDES